MASERTETIIEVDAAEVDLVQAIAADNGVHIETVTQESLEPVTTTVLVLSGGSLAVATVVYLLERRKGGQVIDLRSNAKQVFYRSEGLQYGLVAILTPSGQVRVEVKEPKGMFGIVVESIQALLPQLLPADANQLQAAIEQKLGPAVTVILETK